MACYWRLYVYNSKYASVWIFCRYNFILYYIRNDILSSVGIGDGGNELGMGKLKDRVKSLMPNGSLIACDVPADYAITTGTETTTRLFLQRLGVYWSNYIHSQAVLGSVLMFYGEYP